MKIFEVISVDADNIEADLNSLLISLKANNVTDVPTVKLVKWLRAMGHNVSEDSLLNILHNNPIVQNATTFRVSLSGSVSDIDTSGDKKSDEEVEKLAAKAAKKSIKKH